jgi:uncharacterized repeat protein (TIGR01451 family)
LLLTGAGQVSIGGRFNTATAILVNAGSLYAYGGNAAQSFFHAPGARIDVQGGATLRVSADSLGAAGSAFHEPVIALHRHATWLLDGGQDLTLDNLTLSNAALTGAGRLNSLGGTLRVFGGADTSSVSAQLDFTQDSVLEVADGPATHDLVLAGTVQGAAGLTKAGAGRLVLAGTNASTGPFVISNGTVQVGTGGTQGSLGAGAVSNRASLVFLRGDTCVVSNTITGGGELIQDGTGTLVLAGASGYSGPTLVRTGRLFVGGALHSTGPVQVSGGATLGGTGVVGAVHIDAHGLLVAGDTNQTGLLRAHSLQFGAAADATTHVYLTLGTSTGIVAVTNAGGLSTLGRVRLHVQGDAIPAGAHDLIRYRGGLGGSGFASFSLDTLPVGVAFAHLADSGTSIQFVVTATGFPVWVGGVLGSWDLAGGSEWRVVNSATPMAYTDGQQAWFDDTALDYSVQLPVLVSPQDVGVSNSTAYTFSGLGGIAGAARLTKDGPGLLVLACSNTYVGGTAIGGGTLQIGAGGSAGTLGPGPVTNDGMLVFRMTGRQLLSAPIEGTGALHMAGSGILIVSNTLAYQGVSAFSNGLVQVGAAGGLPGQPILLEGRLAFQNGASVTYTNAVVGTGTLQLAATSVRTVAWDGDLSQFAGTLQLSNAVRLADAGFTPGLTAVHVEVSSSAQFWLGTGAQVRARSLALAGNGWAGDLVNGGMGALRMDQATYTGDIRLTGDAAISPAAGTGVLSGAISGPHRLQLVSGRQPDVLGTLYLRGTNTYASTLLSVDGAGSLLVVAGNAQALSTGSLTVNGGTLRLAGYGMGFASLAGTGGQIENGSGGTPAVLTIGSGQSDSQVSTYSGRLVDGAAASLSLLKVGPGTEQLTHTNTYSGPTWVSNGTLRVDGQLAGTGVVYVASNGVLAGYGSVSNVDVRGGTLAPGPQHTNFTVRGSLLIRPDSTYRWEITNAAGVAGTHWDLLTAHNQLEFVGVGAGRVTLDVVCASASLPGYDSNQAAEWKMASAASVVGFATNLFSFRAADFAPGLGGGTLGVRLDGADLYLTFAPAAATDLGISVADTPDPASVSASVTYTITVTNRSLEAAVLVNVTSRLPAAASYVTSTGGGTRTGEVVRWTLNGGLAPLAATSVTMTVSYPTEGVFTNEVAVQPAGTDTNLADNTAAATTTVTCLSGAGPLVSASDQTATENTLLSFAVLATDPGCGAPVSLVVTGAPTGLSMSTSVTGLQRVGTVNWTPSPAQVGTHVIRFLATDGENRTTSRFIRIYVRASGESTNAVGVPASQLNWSPLTNIAFGSGANVTLVWNSVDGLAYDVYRSEQSLGAGQTWAWTRIVNGTNPAGARAEMLVSAGATQTFFQVVPAGDLPRSNGVWGIIRTEIPTGFGLFGIPVRNDRSFGGQFGSNLAARLQAGDTSAATDDGDSVYVPQPGGEYVHVLLTTELGWVRADTLSPYLEALPPGQGVYIHRIGGATQAPFAGAVGNLGVLGQAQGTNAMHEGYNIIAISEGRLVHIQQAFDDTVASTPQGSWDEEQADQLIVAEPNGSGRWHRYFLSADGVWRDVQLVGYPPADTYLRPGQAYFYLRRTGTGNLNTRF